MSAGLSFAGRRFAGWSFAGWSFAGRSFAGRRLVLCVLAAGAFSSSFSCALAERADYLVGRDCEEDRDCENDERCLPHDYVNDRYEDLRCRSRASFEPSGEREPPIAYCDETRMYFCPGDLECNADRVRLDAEARRRVCKLPDDIFSPPTDAGT